MLRKQNELVGKEQQCSGLVFETGNLPYDENRKQTGQEDKLPPCPFPHAFTDSCPKHLNETRLWEEQEEVKVQCVNVQPRTAPEDLLGATLAPSAFPVFVQHMPANDGGHDSNELIWHLLEMLYLKHFKEAIVLYGLHSPFVKVLLSNWPTQNRVIPQEWKKFVSAELEPGQQ
jgi:hypothetical protein